MAEIQLDDTKTIRVKKTHIEPFRQVDVEPSAAASELSSHTCCDKLALSKSVSEANESAGLHAPDGTSVVTTIASESDECSDTASVTSSRPFGALSLAATTVSAVGNIAQTTLGLAWGGIKIAHIALSGRKEPTYFLRWLFKDDLMEVRPKHGVQQAQLESEFEGRKYELCASKVDSDGKSFFGSPKEVVRLFYVLKQLHGDSLQAKLETVAAFSKLHEACKVASRLELLVSSASPEMEFQMDVADFEMIDEPQPSSDSGGCGFIPESMFPKLFSKPIEGKRTTAIQVRVVSPALGIFKGVLSKKRGISKIQLSPSMRKVGPSLNNDDQWVWMLVTRSFPSKSNLQIGKWVNVGKTPCKSFKPEKLSSMMRRLMTTLAVPKSVISDYARQELRKESWVVGVADPTFPTNVIPSGHVYLSGLPAEQVPLINGQRKVFLTRSPCTCPEDGHLLPLVTSKPRGMSDEDWQAFTERHFGEVIFSNNGNAIPEAISEGDLDGDLYYVCWDETVVRHIKPAFVAEVPAGDASNQSTKVREPLGSNWLSEARRYMQSGDASRTKQMIGKLYCAGEKAADKSPDGLFDPDARAFFKAYAQAIDAGKHGNSIDLPERLRKEVGMHASTGQ
eukprot:TRINITY_DN88813_c0_g1_i1.p1 TRINITY_DN88813_c0_g1~~TRINITY_DN88813_c0_g1_i1.p1  ORF type:complete len:672 (+),score=86.51 TRINITY_DN88813_c0_g1_i1:156-2018(+)